MLKSQESSFALFTAIKFASFNMSPGCLEALRGHLLSNAANQWWQASYRPVWEKWSSLKPDYPDRWLWPYAFCCLSIFVNKSIWLSICTFDIRVKLPREMECNHSHLCHQVCIPCGKYCVWSILYGFLGHTFLIEKIPSLKVKTKGIRRDIYRFSKQ